MIQTVRTQALARRFGETVALDRLTLAVEEGEIFGLVGPDGAGKTTTMRLLTGMLEPSSGEAWVDGLHAVRDAAAIKDRIGYMAQRFGLYPDLTVLENILFYADLYEVPRAGRSERVERLLAFSNLTPFRRRLAGNLSGGMKQKLGLACALIHTPRVLFLDEPTNGVDPVSRRDFWRILYQLQQERVTIFVSTAYLDEAERCNRIGLLHQGRLLACDTVDGVKSLLQGALLEVHCDSPRRAAVLLRGAALGSVALFGDRIHVLAGGADPGRFAVEAALRAEGIPCHSVSVIEPTLEDVFTSAIPRGGSMTELAVTLRDLERRFGDFVAVNRISLDVRRGEIFGFLGPNGAGKSTTIRMLCGLLEPTSGQGTVAGHDIRTQREEIKRCIGYMSQKFSLYDDLTVEENIDFFSGIYRIPRERKVRRKAWVLDMAGLQEHRGARTGLLPGGWKQRLSLGCALLHEPQVLFLDEPTSGVDPLSRRSFWDLIYLMAGQGVTVFVTTHYMEEAEYCDRLALIYRGELVALGTPAEMKGSLMADQVLCIACDRSHEALGVAAAVVGVRDAALFGRDIHLMTEDADALSPRLRLALEAAGFKVGAMARITPSLEDVFVSLIEARDRADGAQKEFTA